jgi:hypothetical protein
VKVYVGTRGPTGCFVTVDGRPLLPRQRPHYACSPTSFEWGYAGSGPASLALAILADHLNGGNASAAAALYQRYKTDVISNITADAWRITEESVVAWVARQKVQQ